MGFPDSATDIGQISYHQRDQLAIVTIDNPNKCNAITSRMWQRLPSMMQCLEHDRQIKVVILTGAGQHFSSGSDIAELDQVHCSDLPAQAEESLANFTKPIIAAISGYCLGGGLQLAAACDIRVASATAIFGLPPAKLGIVYPLSATRRLLSLMGPAATKYLIMTAGHISASHALRLGLIQEMITASDATCDSCLDAAIELAQMISSRSQLTIHATKAIVQALSSSQQIDQLAQSWISQAAQSPDLGEAIASFAEGREPNFSWQPEQR